MYKVGFVVKEGIELEEDGVVDLGKKLDMARKVKFQPHAIEAEIKEIADRGLRNISYGLLNSSAVSGASSEIAHATQGSSEHPLCCESLLSA